MKDFWHLAALMLQRRGALVGAALFACLSAVGLGAGLLGIAPLLDAILGSGRDLPTLARDWSVRLPEWLRPGDAFIDTLPTGPFNAVIGVVAGLALLTVFGAVANFLHQYLALSVVSATVGRIRVRAFEHVVHLPLRTVLGGWRAGQSGTAAAGRSSGGRGGGSDAVSRIVNDSTTLGIGFNSLLSKALAQITKGAAALLAALVLNWKVAIVALPVAGLLGWIIRVLGKRIRRATRAALQGQAGLYHAAAEVVGGLRVVKVHTTEDDETARFAALTDNVVRQELRVRTARALASPLVETLAIFVLGGLVVVAAKAIIDNQLQPTEFILVIGALGVAGASLKPLSALWSDVQQAGAAATRLRELLDLAPEPRGQGPTLPRHTRSIVFDNASLTYPGAEAPAVSGVRLEIPHGATVAFVGPNGSGKTSLLSLVPRLFEPSAGRVLIDGVDLSGVDLRSLRRQIGVVTQDTVLFSGTIRANIAYGMPGATDAQVRDAARRAHAEEFILARPGGYDAELGEGGGGLSGGQRQRLAIARAILRDPAILILDEATSMIDAESEHHIAAAIDEFVAHAHAESRRTCLIVAHRLSTVMHADLIVVMDAGRVVDTGAHADLLRRCDLYRTLAHRQLVHAEPADLPARAQSAPPSAPAPLAT